MIEIHLGERLRSVREGLGWSQQEAGRRAGVDPNMIYQYEAGHRNPSRLALRGLASLYDKPAEWFYGEEEEAEGRLVRLRTEAPDSATRPTPEPSDISPALDERFQNVMARLDRIESFARSMADEQDEPAEPDNLLVRPVEVVEVAAAAGGGAEVYDETVTGRLWFRSDWLQRNAIDPSQCNVITVRGESMEPTLPNGCSILVDRSQSRRRRRVGRVFVMRTEDGLVVKRLGKDEDGEWEIRSDHPAWPPVPWSNATGIIGEVRWAARTF